MYSIVPGSDAMISKSTSGRFNHSVSISEPTTSPRSGKFNKAGRKLINPTTLSNGSTGGEIKTKKMNITERLLKKKEKEKSTIIITDNVTMEELDHILEEDALKLLNIKKEIFNVQEDELKKIQLKNMKLKKDYDLIHMKNQTKLNEINKLKSKENSLKNVEKASNEKLSSVEESMNQLLESIENVEEELKAEQRTIKMLTLMIKRLDAEIGQCRVTASKTSISLEHIKHDVVITDTSLATNKQELIEQEISLEKLNNALISRSDEREKKKQMLQNISIDGEQSIIKLQQSLALASTKRALSRSQNNDRSLRQGRSGTSKNRKRSDFDSEFDEFEDLTDPNGALKRLSAQQVREMATRYSTQSARMEKLKQLDIELRGNIQIQKKKKQEFSEHLAHTLFRIQQLASSRQIYQEVDLKDSALAATSKECDDIKEREHRLRLSIESLKLSIPRFLTKVTKVTHPTPTEDQLPDAILKLEDELTKLIKAVGSALLKDATPDDLAIMSQQSSAATGGAAEAHSEFSRLQRLPGFSRLQRQLFFNMMTAKPDISSQNIRIPIEQVNFTRSKQPKSTSGATALIPESTPYHTGTALTSTLSRPNNGATSPRPNRGVAATDEEEEQDPALDRNTIKNISRLICERDAVKQAAEEELAVK